MLESQNAKRQEDYKLIFQTEKYFYVRFSKKKTDQMILAQLSWKLKWSYWSHMIRCSSVYFRLTVPIHPDLIQTSLDIEFELDARY